jgi:large subunit ribosomal protein L9
MKVLLLQDVPKVGKKGQIVEVSEGYANNMLLKTGKAAIATAATQAKLAKESSEAKAKAERQAKQLEQTKKKLEARSVTMTVKVGDRGQIFGGLHEKAIAEAITSRIGIAVDKNQIKIKEPIKTLGPITVSVAVGGHVTANVKLTIEAQQ